MFTNIGVSSIGRVPVLQAGGYEFESRTPIKQTTITTTKGNINLN
jgi:hypothetical protein